MASHALTIVHGEHNKNNNSTFYGMCYNFNMTKHTIKLTKSSRYSYSVVIPKEFVDKYGWRSKQKLVIKDKGRGVIEIKDWKST